MSASHLLAYAACIWFSPPGAPLSPPSSSVSTLVSDVGDMLPSTLRVSSLAVVGDHSSDIASALCACGRYRPETEGDGDYHFSDADVPIPDHSPCPVSMGSIGCVPTQGMQVDLVLIANTLDTHPEWRGALRALSHTLTPGGWMVVRGRERAGCERQSVLRELTRLGYPDLSDGKGGRGCGHWAVLEGETLSLPGFGDACFSAMPSLHTAPNQVYYIAVHKPETAVTPTQQSTKGVESDTLGLAAALDVLVQERDIRCNPLSYFASTSRSVEVYCAPTNMPMVQGHADVHGVESIVVRDISCPEQRERERPSDGLGVPALVLLQGVSSEDATSCLLSVAPHTPMLLVSSASPLPPSTHASLLTCGMVCIDMADRLGWCAALYYRPQTADKDRERAHFRAMRQTKDWARISGYVLGVASGKGGPLSPKAKEEFNTLCETAPDVDVYRFLQSHVPPGTGVANGERERLYAVNRAKKRAREIAGLLERGEVGVRVQPKAILDLCCGDGSIAASLAREYRIPPCAVVGVDIREPEDRHGTVFVQHNIDNGALDPGAYADLAVCMQALHHVSALDHALSTLYNSLRPGGVCLIKDVEAATPSDRAQLDMQHGVYSCVGDPPEMSPEDFTSQFVMYFRGPKEVEGVAREVGFEITYSAPAGDRGIGSNYWLVLRKPGGDRSQDRVKSKVRVVLRSEKERHGWDRNNWRDRDGGDRDYRGDRGEGQGRYSRGKRSFGKRRGGYSPDRWRESDRDSDRDGYRRYGRDRSPSPKSRTGHRGRGRGRGRGSDRY
ncbi:hypothetical protein KIPB_002372 [Kipferlia bialata]|uniref:Methyltransferase domain-containing protein n=1 Tax=Kipferlia bialata TaxID=797122 RepID=A0A9K3GG23_9EUKA|nr:hypothetical protein KIPB_002372 [Kipferlia bialata]|eukprot:g2372.t1